MGEEHGNATVRCVMGRDTRATCRGRLAPEPSQVKCLLVTCGLAQFHRVQVVVEPGQENAVMFAATVLFLHPGARR